jgi:hypothetical protein
LAGRVFESVVILTTPLKGMGHFMSHLVGGYPAGVFESVCGYFNYTLKGVEAEVGKRTCLTTTNAKDLSHSKK